MINTLIKKTVETFNKATASPEISQPEPAIEPEPEAAPIVPPAEPAASAPEPAPIDNSPQALALRAAEAAGWSVGDEQPMAEICRHQPSKMFLLVKVDNWGEPVICHVKDAMSWRPVNAQHSCLPPPHNRLKCRFTGTATPEGRLIFESSDICKANRLRRAR